MGDALSFCLQSLRRGVHERQVPLIESQSFHKEGFRMRDILVVVIALVLLQLLPVVRAAHAEVATESEMRGVCERWLSYVVELTGDWAGSTSPRIIDAEAIVENDTLLARCFSIAPRGYVVVPVLKELPPVKACSEEYALDALQVVGFPQLLREMLHHRVTLFIETYGSLEASQSSARTPLFDRANREAWNRLSDPKHRPGAQRAADRFSRTTQAGPLVTTAWHQTHPYNLNCPIGDGGRSLVGCVATAVAQIMNYHSWPPAGTGGHAYYWNGDRSCGGATDGAELNADFSDPYAWANMPDGCDTGCSPIEEAAVSELCYEVGVAFEMNFGRCSSGAFSSYASTALLTYFGYDCTFQRERRDDHTAESWFDRVKREIDARRPLLYSIPGHVVVCDGWREWGGQRQVHINYGWGGPHTSWYAVDNIHGSNNHMMERMFLNIMPRSTKGTLYSVEPDGTGEFATIQAAIDAATGCDVIELGDGLFTGEGNRDLTFRGKILTVRSRSGDPAACVIDCQGSADDPRRGFTIDSYEGAGAVIEGITVKNGYAGGIGNQDGGAIHGGQMSMPTLINCAFVDNSAVRKGGAVYCRNSLSILEDCTFVGNESAEGGTICCDVGSFGLFVSGCTITGNEAGSSGAGIHWDRYHSRLVVENTIIASSESGEAIFCDGDGIPPEISCCDIHGNAGGDWVGCVADLQGVAGNFSADPRFCGLAPDTHMSRYELRADSPCLPGNHPDGYDCGLIGAHGQGCVVTDVGSIASDVDEAPDVSPFLTAVPNPSGSGVSVSFGGSTRSNSGIRIFDVAGRLIRSYDVRSLAGVITWDGTTATGRPVAPGTYFVRLGEGKEAMTRRVILLR